MWQEFASPAFLRPDVATALFEGMCLLWLVLLLFGRAKFHPPLGTLLKASSGWRDVYDDDVNRIFFRND